MDFKKNINKLAINIYDVKLIHESIDHVFDGNEVKDTLDKL